MCFLSLSNVKIVKSRNQLIDFLFNFASSRYLVLNCFTLSTKYSGTRTFQAKFEQSSIRVLGSTILALISLLYTNDPGFSEQNLYNSVNLKFDNEQYKQVQTIAKRAQNVTKYIT